MSALNKLWKFIIEVILAILGCVAFVYLCCALVIFIVVIIIAVPVSALIGIIFAPFIWRSK